MKDACNYDPTATLSSAALCTFPTNPYRDCDGNCYNDTDGDEVWFVHDIEWLYADTQFNQMLQKMTEHDIRAGWMSHSICL